MEPIFADNNFTFVWEIHNFSYCTQKTGEYFRSPPFLMSNCEWNVDLFPRGSKAAPDDTGIRLWKEESEFSIKVLFSFSISTNTVLFQETDPSTYTFEAGSNFSPMEFLKVKATHKSGLRFCNTDTLIVKCKIGEMNGVRRSYQEIYNAYSVIDVRKTLYNWKVNILRSLKESKFVAREISLFDNNVYFMVDFSSSKDFSGKDFFKAVIKQKKTNNLYFSRGVISLMDKVSILESERKEHWFERSEMDQVWSFSFTPHKKLSSYRRDIILCFEFAVSKCLETIEHETIAKPIIKSANLCDSCSVPTSWKHNLHRLYSEGIFSDVNIQTQTKSFPVHKAILCAQSKVFTAMLERDIKENQTGIIDIEDLEEDTVLKMLIFIYGGSVENLDWDSALNLYFAAEKYRIEALGKQCWEFLKRNIGHDNVCECLLLADLHHDQCLKSFSQEYVIKHSAEILNSKNWKELMKEKVDLAAETMHLLCLRNFKTA